MNPIVRYIILQKLREYLNKKKEGKLKKYSFLKTFEKFIRGGTAGLIATGIALYTGKDPKVLMPVIVGAFEAIYNVVKFFITETKGE